jgi:protein-S-isoprenylcysteine O-methyltransferase Ste14
MEQARSSPQGDIGRRTPHGALAQPVGLGHDRALARKLVVEGPYRHVRNPMITGVMSILLGEAVGLGSPPLLIWFALFFTVNAVYMPLVEEPGLARRFGDDYAVYKRNVPRWLPRPRPWTPG